jgi:acetolactate synthase-1/2/3 large subunit
VAFVITDLGLTDTITAMGQAYADSIPMLVTSAVNHIGRIGHGEGELHESPNQSLLAAQVDASSFRVLASSDLPKAVARAFAVFEGHDLDLFISKFPSICLQQMRKDLR